MMEKKVSNRPILIMIGGMRCGTRALQRYLSQHPQILPHKKAHDPHFFSSAENWAKGVDAYSEGWASFDPSKYKYRFEASTHYTKYPNVPSVPERMRESGLNFEFIYGVRDPLARIESHMQHNVGKGYFDATRQDSRRKFLKSAVSYSNYAMQLERFERVFPGKEIFVYAMEALQKDYLDVIQPLARFLDLDPAHRFKPVKRIGTKFTAPIVDATLTDAEKLEIVRELEPAMTRFMERFAIAPELWPLWTAASAKASNAAPEPARPDIAAPALRRSYSGQGRFAFLTVDTEALRHRAKRHHVKRLIWGEFKNGTAGIREIASIGKEFGARHVFFVDICESEIYGQEFDDAVRWLHADGQDVQLHAHPEVLPPEFWEAQGLSAMPRRMNEYDRHRSRHVLGYFKEKLVTLTGTKVHAYRAGSFRWNGDTIRAMGDLGLSLSFNDATRLQRKGRNPYSAGRREPYRWDNGVIELPLTERRIALKQKLAAFSFPRLTEGANGLDETYEPFVGKDAPSCLVLLLHSWSLLHWDEDRRAQYRDDQRQEDYRRLIGRMAKDYDIITTGDFLDLMSRPGAPRLPVVPLSATDAYEPEAAA